MDSDKVLMFQVQQGQTEKLREIFTKYQVPLYNFFLRLTRDPMLSEDLVQDVFVRILKYKHTYKGNGSFKGWLFSLARNVCHDYFRKIQRDAQKIPDNVALESEEPDVLDNLELVEHLAVLKAGFARLSLANQEILSLSRFHELKYADIAKMLGCTENVVKVRIHRAMNALKENCKMYSYE